MTPREDGKTSLVALVFIGVMIGLAMVGGVVGLGLSAGLARTDTSPLMTARLAAAQRPPEPRLQIDPLADRAVRADTERLAVKGGPGRLPVDEAMRRLATEGWPQAEAKP